MQDIAEKVRYVVLMYSTSHREYFDPGVEITQSVEYATSLERLWILPGPYCLSNVGVSIMRPAQTEVIVSPSISV